MKCPSCGAEITPNSKFCESCGSQISYDMKREQELLNRQGCPKCGSSNITFNREKQGEIKGKRGTAVVRRTVGVCMDCGNTWYADKQEPQKKSKTWLWVLGWICIFPIPLTILLLRKKDMNPILKYGVIALGWLVYLIIALSGSSEDTKSEDTVVVEEAKQEDQVNTVADETATSEEKTETASDQTDSVDTSSKFKINELPVMNGSQTERIGTYSMCYMLSADCTEETLAEWWAKVKDKDYNWNIIRYADFAGDEDTGVYGNNGLIEKDVHLGEDGSLISNEGETIYVVTEDGSLKVLE